MPLPTLTPEDIEWLKTNPSIGEMLARRPDYFGLGLPATGYQVMQVVEKLDEIIALLKRDAR